VTTSVTDPILAARVYLDAWKIEDYASMYDMLTTVSKDAITEEDFTRRYVNVANEAALSAWDYEILSSLTNPRSAQVGYKVTFRSILVGDFQSTTLMNLSRENGQWQVQWDAALILAELGGSSGEGNYLRMEYDIPSRANIYDSQGSALVAQADAVAIGLDTGALDVEQENALLSTIFQLTGIRPDALRPLIEAYQPFGWYLPVADISASVYAERGQGLGNYAGVLLTPFRTRYYSDGGISPHLVGYMSAIQEAEVDRYRRLGYRWDERVGRDGLEYFSESILAGKRGGSLYLVDKDGNIITRLASTSPEPAQAIYTTINYDLQRDLQRKRALSDGMRGAIVVLERDTGRVLAMVSSPGFNPNLFEPSNLNSGFQIGQIYDPETTPLVNRATQGLYPLGSVFKIITMASALEDGEYAPETEYNCTYFFEELPGHRPNDWTYDHFLEDGKTQASGILTLPQGLMRSCNPWFFHIGLDLYNRGLTTAISNMARSFGLGSPTGIEISEQAGQIPDPISQVDAINLAIGQGNTLVTPLQVVDFIAAVGNDGTLYIPQVIDRIVPVDGEPTYEFSPKVRATLPVSLENLQIIQDAMISVIKNPRGTANWVLGDFSNSYNIPIAGKTGTAESGSGEPHAWFGGYTYAGRENRPDIAVIVLVENGGEGSEVAAPIFRRVLEIYFGITPNRLYPWEAQVGVVATPEPEVTETPTPEVTETPTPSPGG
jgi:penicillin-binding protein 2